MRISVTSKTLSFSFCIVRALILSAIPSSLRLSPRILLSISLSRRSSPTVTHFCISPLAAKIALQVLPSIHSNLIYFAYTSAAEKSLIKNVLSFHFVIPLTSNPDAFHTLVYSSNPVAVVSFSLLKHLTNLEISRF